VAQVSSNSWMMKTTGNDLSTTCSNFALCKHVLKGHIVVQLYLCVRSVTFKNILEVKVVAGENLKIRFRVKIVPGVLLRCKTADVDSLHHRDGAGELLLEVSLFFWGVEGKDFFVVGGNGVRDEGGVRLEGIPVDHGVYEVIS
jgi:hypothetical protein